VNWKATLLKGGFSFFAAALPMGTERPHVRKLNPPKPWRRRVRHHARKDNVMKYMIFLMLIAPVSCFATSYQPSGEYQTKWCTENGGTVNYVHEDDTSKVACIKGRYIVDVDHVGNWKEALGQALYFSAITGRKPGVALIVPNSTEDANNFKNLKLVAGKFNIKVWEIK
jgi:hypothetical protein